MTGCLNQWSGVAGGFTMAGRALVDEEVAAGVWTSVRSRWCCRIAMCYIATYARLAADA
jgi:hypothetical protein